MRALPEEDLDVPPLAALLSAWKRDTVRAMGGADEDELMREAGTANRGGPVPREREEDDDAA